MTRTGDCVDLMVRERRFPGRRAAESYLGFLFGDLSFEGGRMLSIEPAGWFGLYAGCNGAAEVTWLCPRPPERGRGRLERFERWRAGLELQPVVAAAPDAFPDLPGGESFDIILIHDSIHRFDERACSRLSRNLRAVKTYKRFLKQIARAADAGATLIVTGYSRYNLFPFFHLPNPFAPGVEWDRQQSPSIWSSLFRQVGFAEPRTGWAVPAWSGAPGRKLIGNSIGAYFYSGHFRITFKKPDTG